MTTRVVGGAYSLLMNDTGEPLWMHLRRQRLTPRRLLAYLGITRPPIDVEAIAKDLGVDVRYHLDEGYSGAILAQQSPPSAVMWVSGREPRVRRRFTIGHELGHLMLHPLGVQFRDDNFKGSLEEAQANRYAAELLMPLWMVRVYAEQGWPSDETAATFGVSAEAMRYTYKKLGYS